MDSRAVVRSPSLRTGDWKLVTRGRWPRLMAGGCRPRWGSLLRPRGFLGAGIAEGWQCVRRKDSPVGLATMANTHDAHFATLVVYLVYDAVVADSHPPVSIRPGQLATPGRPGIVGENPQRSDHTSEHGGIEATQAPLSGRFEKDGVHVCSTAARHGLRLGRHRPANTRSARPTGCGNGAGVRACAEVPAGHPGLRPAPAVVRIRRCRE